MCPSICKSGGSERKPPKIAKKDNLDSGNDCMVLYLCITGCIGLASSHIHPDHFFSVFDPDLDASGLVLSVKKKSRLFRYKLWRLSKWGQFLMLKKTR